MAPNAALLVSFLAAATAAGEPSAGIKFPFHLPDNAMFKAQQEDAVLQTKKQFDHYCFNFMFSVFEKHDTMDEVEAWKKLQPLCRAGGHYDECKKWSADLVTAHENKKRRHDKKAGPLLVGPQSSGDWCAELYVAAQTPVKDAPVEDAPAKPEVHAQSALAPRALLRGQATHAHAEHVEHVLSEAAHAEPSPRVERTHFEHGTRTEHACSVCHHVYDAEQDGGGQAFEDLPDSWVCPVCGAPKSDFSSTMAQVVPAKNGAVKTEAKKSVVASEHKYEQVVLKAAESPTKPKEVVTKPKEVAHELPKVAHAKSTTATPATERPAPAVKPTVDKVVTAVTPAAKTHLVASATTVAPVEMKKPEETRKPVEMKKPEDMKKPAETQQPMEMQAASTKKSVATKVQKKSSEADECVCFKRDDGQHCSCPPGKTPPLPVDAQGAVIAAKATELPAKNEAGLSSLWGAFSGAAKGLFSSLQMRW